MSSASNKPRLLVVDDDEDIRALLRLILERAGYEVDEQPDGRSALRAFHTGRHDLVILDVTMPDLDGWEILDRIRDLSEVPVLMLTARDSEVDRVRGLRAGADDYVAKPFDRDELLARVEVLLRRAPREEEPVSYGDSFLHVDFVQRAVSVEGREVGLTRLEYNLLEAFVRHPNQVLSQEQLLELAWDEPDSVSRDQVKLYVGYLRRKLGSQRDASPIETVRGFGYRFRPAGRS
ncbi:MAG: response regulator transcription factor [Actinobacteria bacterium]|nr:MAG: response regulator transcription factor [Actinomycetota bacterium]